MLCVSRRFTGTVRLEKSHTSVRFSLERERAVRNYCTEQNWMRLNMNNAGTEFILSTCLIGVSGIIRLLATEVIVKQLHTKITTMWARFFKKKRPAWISVPPPKNPRNNTKTPAILSLNPNTDTDICRTKQILILAPRLFQKGGSKILSVAK